MSKFLEEIIEENINEGDFIIRKPISGITPISYLGIVTKIHNNIVSVGTSQSYGSPGISRDRKFSMGYFMTAFKKIKKDNIKEINNHNSHYFYIQEPILKEDFFDYQRHGKRTGHNKDFMVSLVPFPKNLDGNIVILDNHKVGEKINELENSGIDFSIHVIHKVSTIISERHGNYGLERRDTHLKSKIHKVILKTK